MKERIELAEKRIRKYILTTPLEFSPSLSKQTGAEVYLKVESMQTTGSFKLRGAMNKLVSLSPAQLRKGVITASTGNHAQAVAHALAQLGGKGTIWMPETVTEPKRKSLSYYQGVEVALFGSDSVEAELKAVEEAKKYNLPYISPYNDDEIIAGQGTMGIELMHQLPDLEAVFVPIGGGGMISGIASYLKAVNPNISIIGCQPENSAAMYHSIQTGKVVEIESLPTLSDGTAGGIEPNTITFNYCRQWADNYSLLTESEITTALKHLLQEHYLLVEGAAALSVAALLKNSTPWKNKKVVLILCGRKMSLETLKTIICQ